MVGKYLKAIRILFEPLRATFLEVHSVVVSIALFDELQELRFCFGITNLLLKNCQVLYICTLPHKTLHILSKTTFRLNLSEVKKESGIYQPGCTSLLLIPLEDSVAPEGLRQEAASYPKKYCEAEIDQ